MLALVTCSPMGCTGLRLRKKVDEIILKESNSFVFIFPPPVKREAIQENKRFCKSPGMNVLRMYRICSVET